MAERSRRKCATEGGGGPKGSGERGGSLKRNRQRKISRSAVVGWHLKAAGKGKGSSGRGKRMCVFRRNEQLA